MKFLLLASFIFIIQFLPAQNVGIGTSIPIARLHVADSAVIFTGPNSLPANAGILPIVGAGTRMMWVPTKGAFRVGGVTGTHWNNEFVGNYSAAFGLSNRAAGKYATSFGWGNSSSGDGSFTTGNNNVASGRYAAALGTGTDAQAYGSLVMGRYNILAGDANAWIDNDPLFVIGNGYVQEISPGIGEVVRRNALTIQKTGIATFHNQLIAGDNLRVGGFGIFDQLLHVKGDGDFRKDVAVAGKLAVDTIENLKVINAEYANGTTPEVNLVPLGVVEFKGYFSVSPINNSPNTTYTNLAANFVTSVTGLYNEGLGIGNDAVVGIRLNFNTAKAGDYKEVIAVGHSYFNGIGLSSNTTLSATGTIVSKDEVTGKPISCTILFRSSGLPATGDFSSSGTYMFYGLK